MKLNIGILTICLGAAATASADVSFQFSLPYSGGIASNFANSSGTVTDGMQWGIIVDTAGNGFANSSVNYDAYTAGVTTAGFLSASGSVTDDYYIPGTTTVDTSGLQEGDFTTVGSHGSIADDLVSVPLSHGVATGRAFALVWFNNKSSASGSKYGFFTDASFVVPGDGETKDFSGVFVGADPIRSASKTLGIVLSNAKIAVFDGNGTGGGQRTDNTGTYSFPNAVISSSGVTQTFTLENTGGLDLTSISVSKGAGGNPGDFSINTTGMATTLAANATTTFTVTFAPTSVGSKTATIQIASSDSTQNPFRINVGGIGTATAGPSIAVFDGAGTLGSQRSDNVGVFTFAPIQASLSSPTYTFTVQNNGTSVLNDLSLAVTGANPGDFDVSGGTASTLATNATVTFTVTFRPLVAGTRTGTVTLSSSTNSSVTPFRVNFSGRATALSTPRIDVLKGDASGLELVNGGAAVGFPTTLVGNNSVVQVFTLKNIGASDLTGISVTKVNVGNASDFVLDASSVATTLATDATTTFTVKFAPTAIGLRTGLIQIASSDPTDNPFNISLQGQTHTLSFDQASISHKEAKETVTIPVRLSSVFGSAFTVPVTFSAPSDLVYSHTPTSSPASNPAVLSFKATDPFANLTLVLTDNTTISANKTITMTLGTPSNSGVVLGAFSTMTFTIVDNDTPPVIVPVPTDKIVAAGSAVNWVAGATGSDPLKLAWKKGAATVASTANYSIPTAALTDAGAYVFSATNDAGTKSATVQLVVVDPTPTTLKFDVNTNATMSVVYAGTAPTFKWYKRNGGSNDLLSNGTKYANATTKTLTIKTLTTADRGDYFCAVTTAAGTVNGGTVTLNVPSFTPPTVTIAFPDCVAYNTYPAYQIPFDTVGTMVPTSITCIGLPTGLICNPSTGIVTGKPTKVGLNQMVKVTLKNATGHVDINTTINIIPFPSTGTVVGAVARHPALNSSLGGRVDLTLASTGSFTGTLKLGGSSYPISGAMTTASAAHSHPMATVSVARTGTPKPTPYALMLDINPDTNLLTGTVGVTGDASTAAIAGWRNKWSTTTPVTAQLGVHAFEMSLDTGSAALTNAPAGHGYGTVTVTNTGITTVTSHVGDGSAVSTSGVLGPSGEVLVFQTLYTNKGSVTGTIGINADSTHSIVPASDGGHPLASLLVWQKLAGTSTRDPSPFPGNLGVEVTGGLYTATTPYAGLSATTVGGATFSAQLLFSGANVNASLTNPDVSLWVTNKNVISFPTGTANPGSITALTVTSTGGFNGKFTLKDGSVLRSSIAFQGQLVPNHGSAVASDKGFGNFLLPQLASPPTTTASTSPILSGAVVLKGL